jgi:hypothetical protein
MNKKQMFVKLLMALFLIAGLFGPPAQVVSAKDTDTFVYIRWIKPPPAVVCVGDEVPIAFVFFTNPVDTVVKGTLNGSTLGKGTITPSTWKTNNYYSYGIRGSTYKPVREGNDQITITGSGFEVASLGASTDVFEVLKCNYDITIGASDFVDGEQVKIDTQFSAKGKIKISDSGDIYGTGADKYKVSVTYIPPKTITCDKPLSSNNNSTFKISGTATPTTVQIEFIFEEMKINPVMVRCIDAERQIIYTKLTEEASVNPGKELGLTTLTFSAKASEFHYAFNYGKGWGMVWIVKRKAK